MSGGNAQAAYAGKTHWVAWAIGGFGAGLCGVVFILWGLNGPIYLFDLIAAYCGF